MRTGRPPKLDAKTISAAAIRIRNGEVIKLVASDLDVSVQTLRRAFNAVGVESRQRFKLQEETIAAVAQQVSAGGSVTRAARDNKVTAPNLFKILKRRGIVTTHRSYKTNPKLTQPRIEAAAQRVKAGESINALASEFEVGTETLRMALSRIGVKSQYKVGQRPLKISDDQLAMAAMRVLAGDSLRKASSDINVTSKSLKRRLDRIKIRPSHQLGETKRVSKTQPKVRKDRLNKSDNDGLNFELPLDAVPEQTLETKAKTIDRKVKSRAIKRKAKTNKKISSIKEKRAPKMSGEQLRIAAARLNAKETLRDVAKDNGISPPGLRVALRRAGIDVTLRVGRPPGTRYPRPHGLKLKLTPDELRAAAARITENKETLKKVAPDFEVTPTTLGKSLARINVRSVHKGGTALKLSFEELAAAHARIQAGELPKQVALSVGMSSGQALRYSFNKAGLGATRKFVKGNYPALSPRQIERARHRRRIERVTIKQLASQFNVSKDTMRKVLNGTYKTIKTRPEVVLKISKNINLQSDPNETYILQLIQHNGYQGFLAVEQAAKLHRLYLKLAAADYRALHVFLAEHFPQTNRANIGRHSKNNRLSLPNSVFLTSTTSTKPKRARSTISHKPTNSNVSP